MKNTQKKEWVIQRCTQCWIDGELQYEDFATKQQQPMTRAKMITVLHAVGLRYPESEFRGHRLVVSA